MSIPVGLFVIAIGANSFAGILDLRHLYSLSDTILQSDDNQRHYFIFWHLTNLLVWAILGLLPFLMAASLTQVCQSMRTKGHQIRVRPRVYQSSSSEDLNSILLFVSSLQIKAQLFLIPIQYNYICGLVLIASIIMLAFGIYYNPTFHVWFGLI